MNLSPLLLLVVLAFVWLIILTILFIKFFFYYSRLTKKGKKESLVQLIDDVLKKEDGLDREIAHMKEIYVKLEKAEKLHIQRIGLVRFNPFKDTGGDQSFILALVDANDTGVVISSLHTRTGTRWYAKQIQQGKGVEYDLSKDEQNALKSATTVNNSE